MREREILQIALGSPACEATTHLLNLQGLAATSANPEDDDDALVAPCCRAGVTHGVTNQLRVPRALLIDHAHNAFRRSSSENPELSTNNDMQLAWSGQIQSISINALAGATESPPSFPQSVPEMDPFLQVFRETSSLLSGSHFSRYRVQAKHQSSSQAYASSSSNSRHVNWDDLGDEEEEDQQAETEHERRERLRRQRRQWQGGTLAPLQNQLDTMWCTILDEESPSSPPPSATEKGANGDKPREKAILPDDLMWTDYLAPPYHPRSILSLPSFQEDAYFPVASGTCLSTWTEDEVLERIRNMLEDCDACQGSILSASGFGIFAGLATQVLHYLQDECPSASRVVLSFDETTKRSTMPSNPSIGEYNTTTDGQEPATDWRTHHVETTREYVNKASAWSDYWESAHAILPLQLQNQNYPSQFHAAAALASALEASTLPFRVCPNDRCRIGMNSFYYGSLSGDSDFGTVPSLSLSEFLGIVKPRDKLSVLELDALARGATEEPLWPSLVEGTSVERDRRMREFPQVVGNRRPRDVLPGRWLLGTDQGGRLSSLSMTGDGTDRSLHTHFALATAIRPSAVGVAPLPHYVDCMMQSMGIRFRPEQSVATAVEQSLLSVTADGYGAGSYWRSLCKKNQPVVAVMGNTTRFYPRAHAMATNLKTALSSRSRAFYNRDVAGGLLAEIEDCQEALSTLWDLRDLYQPPHGSGLVDDADGDYVGW